MESTKDKMWETDAIFKRTLKNSSMHRKDALYHQIEDRKANAIETLDTFVQRNEV